MGGIVRDAKNAGTLAGRPSFVLKFRLLRLLWLVSWFLLAYWTPRPFFGWRRLVLRAFGAKMTPTSRVYGSTRIWWPGHLEMGPDSSIGPRAKIYCMGRIRIGAGTIVSQDAHLCAGTHDYDDPAFQLLAQPIDIGSRVWIAAEAFVGPASIVPDGCVIGARAVVRGELEPWGVYVGNPAERVKERKH